MLPTGPSNGAFWLMRGDKGPNGGGREALVLVAVIVIAAGVYWYFWF